ncbi:TPA: GIY-YIG nuclease family protein [Escherichia coli]|nr:GIY-YIG nuclease family protein [Escherichia coli]
MSKLTHEEQIAVIAKFNPGVEVLGEITRNNAKVLCRCKVCDHEWSVRPYHLKRGSGCPKCKRAKISQKLRLSHDEQIAAIAKVISDVEVLGKITGSREKVLCRCKVCNHKWYSTPDVLKSGKGCPECKYLKIAQKLTLSHEYQISAIAKVNPDIEVLGEIIKDKTKVLCRCKNCDHKWYTTPHELKQGQGCPKCAKTGFLSHEYGKLYIMVDDLEVPTQMKIGVSVRENKRRNEILKSAHKAGVRIPDLHIVKTLEGPTKNIQELESTMHKAFSNYKINFPVKFDGSNEFFYYRPEVFGMVEEAYKEIVCCQ